MRPVRKKYADVTRGALMQIAERDLELDKPGAVRAGSNKGQTTVSARGGAERDVGWNSARCSRIRNNTQSCLCWGNGIGGEGLSLYPSDLHIVDDIRDEAARVGLTAMLCGGYGGCSQRTGCESE